VGRVEGDVWTLKNEGWGGVIDTLWLHWLGWVGCLVVPVILGCQPYCMYQGCTYRVGTLLLGYRYPLKVPRVVRIHVQWDMQSIGCMHNGMYVADQDKWPWSALCGFHVMMLHLDNG
jgi:hypothetical protein